MHQGFIPTRRIIPAAILAALFFALFFGSLTWFASGTSVASETPVPCAPGSATCYAAVQSQAGSQVTASQDAPSTPASGKTDPAQTGTGGATPPGPGTGRPRPDAPGSSGNGAGGGQGNDTVPPEVTPEGPQPDFVEDDPSLNGGAQADSNVVDDPLQADPLTVPNFVIEKFEIPPFLLPIYQACGSQYGIPWYVLASINRAETNFGRDLSTSYAGAMGWMQFMPTSWAEWGVDANGDKIKDPNNPVDAICSAANYLDYFGYKDDPYKAIFAYNHADWYVQIILDYAKVYSEIPTEVISALTGLTEGARFPVAAGDASYEGQISTEAARNDGTTSQDITTSADRRTIAIAASGGSPVIAVNDGMITGIDHESGTVVLEDVYGNRYTYAGLGSVSTVHPVPRPKQTSPTVPQESDIGTPVDDGPDPDPDAEAEMGEEKAADNRQDANPQGQGEGSPRPTREQQRDISEVLVDPDAAAAAADSGPAEEQEDPAIVAATDRRSEQARIRPVPEEADHNSEDSRGRVYASPLRPSNHRRATTDGQSIQNSIRQAEGIGIDGKPGDYLIYDGSKSGIYRFDPESTELHELKKGSRVVAGTVLGRLAETAGASVNFSIKPGGEEAPQIDPKPFLDGWKLLAETNIYSARGKDRFSNRLGAGGILLLSKSALQKRVLGNEKIEFTKQCDRDYIAGGSIDRRILATLEFVAAHGYSMLITSMYCGREGSITTSGNVSNHTRGSAVDIAAFNGEIVTAATQGPGSLTDQVSRLVLSLQGTMAPDEVISLLSYPQPAGFAMGDHDDHLHIGFRPMAGAEQPGGSIGSSLGAEQWNQLTERLGQIRNPEVPTTPSRDSLPAGESNQGK